MIRIFDFLISFIALVVFSPLFLIIMVILKFSGENEIFYYQKRVGKDGKEFGLLKFATMVKNSSKIGSKEITVPNDPRVLPFGRFLRKSKINELPQIWNVLNGDISIVGPRPMVPNTYRNYPKDHQKILNKVCPGLTGIGSIIFRDEEKFLIDKDDPMKFYINHIIPYKSSVEVWYVNNKSILMYFKVIFMTAWVIIFPNSLLVDKVFSSIPKKPDFLINK